MSASDKTWWAPVWRGLVVDPSGKHYRRLKSGVWLLLYLVLHADREGGTLVRKYATIARDTGISRWTIRSWMRRLVALGYLRLAGSGRAVTIEVRRWRALGQPFAPLGGRGMPLRGANGHNGLAAGGPNREQGRGETEAPAAPNKSSLTRVSLQQRPLLNSDTRSATAMPDDRRPQSREELLAADVAHGLDDPAGFPRYLRDARRYPESLLRRLLSEARAIPSSRIKRSRAAVFRYLVHRHADASREDPRS